MLGNDMWIIAVNGPNMKELFLDTCVKSTRILKPLEILIINCITSDFTNVMSCYGCPPVQTLKFYLKSMVFSV